MEEVAKVATVATIGFIGASVAAGMSIWGGIQLIQRHQLISAERKKWQQDHTIIYDKIARDRDLPLLECFQDGDELTLAYVDNSLMGFAYQHWFVTNQFFLLEFGGPGLDMDTAKVHILQRNYSDSQAQGIVVSSCTMDSKIRDRMRHVLGMCNYSLCLRNCEHVANYIFRGRWTSHQLDNDGVIMTVFKTKIADDILPKINSFPALIRPHIFDPNQPKTSIYSFIDDNFVASRFEYYLDSNRDENYNILLIGPTGAGKSRLINVLFNQEICESDISLESVTREVYFVRGKGDIFNEATRRMEQREIVIADTVGLCDHKWNDEKVLSMIKGRVGCNVRHLDAVFILFNAAERLPKNFVENIEKVLAWLQYPKRASTRFMFVGTKSDYIEDRKKKELADQFYRNFKLKREPQRADGSGAENENGPVVFVGFPSENALIGNEATTEKCKQSWKVVRNFLCRQDDGVRIAVPRLPNDRPCIVL